MACRLGLALLALVAGCVDLVRPPMVTLDLGVQPERDGGPRPDRPIDVGRTPDTDHAPDLPPDPEVPDATEVPVPEPDALPPDAPVDLLNGEACATPSVCASGICSEGVCCDQPCTELCRSCKVPGAVGSCTRAPAGTDPRQQCPAQGQSTCGRAGGCDGAGACRLYPDGTGCGTPTCTGSTETSAYFCDGAGSCRPDSARSCAPYQCAGAACGTGCTSVAQCTTGNVCFLNGCVPQGSLPALYWAFDEASGTTTALDGSGNGREGLYTGSTGSPDPTTGGAPLMFTNLRSRTFTIANREGVRLANMPTALKPANNITVSVWYRATQIDTDNTANGSDLVSAGDNYMLRLTASDVHFIKRTNTGTTFDKCFAMVPGFNPLDGQWHHVAGLTSSTGMKVYIDGQQGCSNTVADPISHSAGLDLWVGRHGNDDPDRDFDGQIDDVRIYTRVLSETEIRDLAAGRR
jgi:hypothetical protein